MDYKTALKFIHGRPRLRKEPTVKRMTAFLDQLGNPQDAIQGIHVAGTNGKGSTIAFLAKMVEATGQRVGTFTSPYLERFNERIAVNGIPIRDDEILTLVEEIKPIVDELDQTPLGGPLEFEIVTAMMFLYFKKHPVDIVLIEVGIGGRYDSTNVFTPIASVITNIGWDHMQILGDTLPKIAFQKAGIIKTNVPVITGTEDQAALRVIEEEAKKLHAPLKILKRDFKIDFKENFFSNTFARIDHIHSGLLGLYQVNNLTVALETMLVVSRQLNWKINYDQLRQAVQHTQWAGRMEIIQKRPKIILDGAHNLPGIQALKKSIQAYWPEQKVFILAAILDDKRFEAMLTELVDLKQVELTLTRFNGPIKRAAVDWSELHDPIRKDINYQANWQLALKEILRQAKPSDVIIITGSLYFISEVRPQLIK